MAENVISAERDKDSVTEAGAFLSLLHLGSHHLCGAKVANIYQSL